MTQFASPETVRADFNGVVLTNENARFTLTRTNDELWVHMERNDAEAFETSGRAADARIGMVTGCHHMQVFWIPSEQGNAQVGFPFTWLIPEHRWVPRKATFIRPPDAPHLAELWNVSCSRCHTTAVVPRVDRVHFVADTQVGELGIACEACHGPGQAHVDARRAAPGQEIVEAAVIAHEIVQPKNLDPVRASQICGFCHSMKWFDKSEGWREHGFRYRPGDDLEQTTPVIRPSRLEAIPGMAAYVARSPDLLRDFFWSDGMIRVSGRDYNGLIESPCYRSGQFSCLSCHSLHKSDPDGLLDRTKAGNRACTQCHEKLKGDSELVAHTHHPKESSGSECYNCHMPHTTYGVLKAIRSHQISSPKIADELATGRPNACNLCHLDKSLGWTAGWLTQWTGQSSPAEVTGQAAAVADSVRLALQGDAGQRALMAWHFGWEPAVRASGKSWIPAVLAELLDDPYAAVRCIAERSLKKLGGSLPESYDFTQSMNERGSVRAFVLEKWLMGLSKAEGLSCPAETLVQLTNQTATLESLDALIRNRDDRYVRLRE